MPPKQNWSHAFLISSAGAPNVPLQPFFQIKNRICNISSIPLRDIFDAT